MSRIIFSFSVWGGVLTFPDDKKNFLDKNKMCGIIKRIKGQKMEIIKPYGDNKELWYRIPKRQHPDDLMMQWLRGQGEFSVYADLILEKSLRERAENRGLIYA